MSQMDHGTSWARVQNTETGSRGWLNLQTEEIFPDRKMKSLLTAAEQGVVVGDPLQSTEWISAERDLSVVYGEGSE